MANFRGSQSHYSYVDIIELHHIAQTLKASLVIYSKRDPITFRTFRPRINSRNAYFTKVPARSSFVSVLKSNSSIRGRVKRSGQADRAARSRIFDEFSGRAVGADATKALARASRDDKNVFSEQTDVINSKSARARSLRPSLCQIRDRDMRQSG